MTSKRRDTSSKRSVVSRSIPRIPSTRPRRAQDVSLLRRIAPLRCDAAGPMLGDRERADGQEARGVSDKFTVPTFKLESGRVLPDLTLAYEPCGRLGRDRRNAILVTHGFTGNHRAAGKDPNDPTAGWWDGLIGPGKVIDTDRYFVVSSNMLGSSFGSTAPASRNSTTDKPYGPDFPDITLRDIVGAQKVLLEGLGVQHLVAVAGPSYGGYQTFQWAVTYPTFMSGVVPVVSAPKGSGGDASVKALRDRVATDPNWNGGRDHHRPRPLPPPAPRPDPKPEPHRTNELPPRTIPHPGERA